MNSDTLPITGPCPIDLDAIGFDRSGRVSHCTHCRKNVHQLSNMTREQARSFLRDNKGKTLCISYARDAQGSIRFRQPPVVAPAPVLVPVGRLHSRRSRAAGMVAAFGMGVALAACAPHGEGPPTPDVAEIEAVVPTAQDPRKPAPVEPVEVVEPVEPVEPVEVMARDRPTAGVAVIPDEMMDGEIEVPDLDVIDPQPQPCDGEDRPSAKVLVRNVGAYLNG